MPRIAKPPKPFVTPRHWLEFATELLALPTSPFHEQNVMQWLMGFADQRGLKRWFDPVGNLFIQHQGHPPPRRRKPGAGEPLGPGMLAFSAHVDHPGFWALQMLRKGELEAHWMGGVPPDLFLGAKVVFWTAGDAGGPGSALGFSLGGKRVRGRIIKFTAMDEKKRMLRVKVKVEADVAPGSIGMWDLPDPAVKGGLLSARGIDDVAGAASLCALLDELARTRSEHWVLCVFTRAEEGGFFGCIDLCQQMRHAGDEAGAGQRSAAFARIIGVETSRALPGAPQGGGPIIRVGDRKTLFDPRITAWMTATAEKLAADDRTFRYQRKLMDGGTCESSVYGAYGFAAGGLCLALGNYHNVSDAGRKIASETIDVSDYGNLVRLYLGLVENYHALRGREHEFKTWCDEWHARHRHLFSDPVGRV